jgi:hypothetical protein
MWNGVDDPKKLAKSATRTYGVTVTSLEILDSVRGWLRDGRHPFKSATVDSLMEFQMRVTDKVRPGTQALRDMDWGTLLREAEKFCRDLRDMTILGGKNPEAQPLRMVVFVAGATRDQDLLNDKREIVRVGKIRPLMQGQINKKVPYFCEVVAYLEKNVKGGQTQFNLWIDQRPQNDLDVKDGTNDLLMKYGPCITYTAEKPITLETLFNSLLPKEN